MADRTLNEISSATDFANAYTEDASGNQVKISKADMASVLAEQMNISSFSVAVSAITDKTYVLYISTNKIGTQAIGIHVVKHSDETVEVIPFVAQYSSDKGKYTLTFSPPLNNGDVVVSFFSVI